MFSHRFFNNLILEAQRDAKSIEEGPRFLK